jgi:hypothetical protein
VKIKPANLKKVRVNVDENESRFVFTKPPINFPFDILGKMLHSLT